MSLADAMAVLNSLSNACPLTDRSQLIAGALALDIAAWASDDRDVADAAIALRMLATGGELDLDETGRRRAAHLASVISALITAKSK